jgi:FixJ family two-component response regulator
MLRSLERGLRVRGYETEAYRCVTEFLGRARFEKSRCLLLDIDLKGQSGIDVACKLKADGSFASHHLYDGLGQRGYPP